MTEQYTGWEISHGVMTGDLFDGTSADDNVDQDATLTAFCDELLAAIRAAFPGADVSIPTQRASGVTPWDLQTQVYGPSEVNADPDAPEATIRMDRERGIAATVDAIRGDVYQRGTFWRAITTDDNR